MTERENNPTEKPAERPFVILRTFHVPRELMWKAWTERERLVFTSSALEDKEGNPQLEVLNTVAFAELNGKTALALQATVVRSAPAVARALEGMEEGWSQSLERLGEFVAKT